jgi:octaprenyl-diphosphate synthase
MSIAEYRQILVQKTGALCGAACRLGGWKGGASRLEQRLLKRFGILLGLAFQIYDDWLDYWGTDHVGKTLGTDLEQGKPTLPVLRYLSKSSDEDRATMLELLASDSRTRFSQVRGMLDQSDASEYTLRVAQQLSQKAVEVLEPLPNSESRQFLGAIAHFSAQRSA